jgi:hypothetical protein
MRFFMLLMGLSLSLFACQDPPECDADTPCEFGSVCKVGTCTTIGCATSAQCDMEQFCESGACTPGCEQDDDCYPGDHCNVEAGQCESSGCVDTRLDCGYKEFCNEFSGECYDAGGYYCKECNDDFDCGGNGNYCTGTGYCGVTCESDNDCPSGFSCSPFVDINGNVVFYQCFTYCWLYDDYESEIPEDNAGAKAGVWPQLLQPELPTCSIIEEAIRSGVGR